MKLVLVDDEPLALDFLEFQLRKLINPGSLHKFTYLDANEHKSLLLKADIIFLDVEMPGANGLELAEQILEINHKLEIVFVTGFNHYAVQAFELNALDYLIKPVQVDRLKKTLERLEKSGKRKPSASSNSLFIQLCGELAFKLDGKPVESLKWRTIKSKEVFIYLLHYRGKTIRKSEIVEMFWTDLQLDKAYSQLYTAIYHIRNILKEYSNHITIQNVSDGYKLVLENVTVDIEEWQNEISTAPPIHLDTLELYENAMKLYTQPYLNHYDFHWAESEQFRLEQIWCEIAMRMAQCYEKYHFYEDAVRWYDKICNLRPYDEEASFALMKLYASLDYGLLVNHQYSLLEKSLKEDDLEISTGIQDWYRKWRTK